MAHHKSCYFILHFLTLKHFLNIFFAMARRRKRCYIHVVLSNKEQWNKMLKA